MIVRVLSVKIAQGRGAEFHAFIRETGLPKIQAHPGLVSAHVGRRTDGQDEFAVVVTIWRDWDALTDALGPDPSRPYLLTPESGLAETATVEHFEAIDLPPLAPILPGDAAEMRTVAPHSAT
ncbi:MAG: antibiotic biosynthesis monooxygenase [Chloroflexota bacterium]